MTTTVQGLTDRTLAAYDADHSGTIDYTRSVGNEARRDIQSVELSGAPDPIFGHDRYVRITTTWSQLSLFRAADADQDGHVSRAELQHAIATCDADGDGQLSSRGWAFWQPPGELERFEAQFGEQIVATRREPM